MIMNKIENECRILSELLNMTSPEKIKGEEENRPLIREITSCKKFIFRGLLKKKHIKTYSLLLSPLSTTFESKFYIDSIKFITQLF